MASGKSPTTSGSTSHRTANSVGNGLNDKIVQLLSVHPSAELKPAEIAKNLGLVSAKDVNPTLYQMQKMGLVKKMEGSPPKWKIKNNVGAEYSRKSSSNFVEEHDSDSPSGDKRSVSSPVSKPANFKSCDKSELSGSIMSTSLGNYTTDNQLGNDLEEHIIKVLTRQLSTPLKTVDIAKQVGLSTAKDVNPTLYKMKNKGLIVVQGEPPAWKLAKSDSHTGVNNLGREPHTVRLRSQASRDRNQSTYYEYRRYSKTFDEVAKLGEGGFGTVFRARLKLTNTEYAVKRIKLENSDKALKKALKEVKALEQLTHPNIVRYYSVWIEGPGEFGSEGSEEIDDEAISETFWLDPVQDMLIGRDNVCLFIQMELCQTSNLADWLLDNLDRDTDEMLLYFRQIVDAVSHIHSLKLIHRDLKPSNILFSVDGCLKIGDFGLVTAQEYSSSGDGSKKVATHTKGVGTELYQSPEQSSGGSYSQDADIYSLGVIFIEIMSSFSTETVRRVELQDLKESKEEFLKKFHAHYPEGRSFVAPLLADPQDRPTVDIILKSALLSKKQKTPKQFLSH